MAVARRHTRVCVRSACVREGCGAGHLWLRGSLRLLSRPAGRAGCGRPMPQVCQLEEGPGPGPFAEGESGGRVPGAELTGCPAGSLPGLISEAFSRLADGPCSLGGRAVTLSAADSGSVGRALWATFPATWEFTVTSVLPDTSALPRPMHLLGVCWRPGWQWL